MCRTSVTLERQHTVGKSLSIFHHIHFVVKPFVHFAQLVCRTVSHVFLVVNATGSYQCRIKSTIEKNFVPFLIMKFDSPLPIDIVGGHEYDTGFRRCDTVQTIQQATKRHSIQSLVGGFLLGRFVTRRKRSINVFQQDNRLLGSDAVFE